MGVRIALDVMGGDFAPGEVIRGAILAKKDLKGLNLILVGDRSCIEKYLRKLNSPFNFSIEDAPEVITMEDPPALSVRHKKNSSIVKGICLLKDWGIQGFVSAGNTGAVVCASTIFLGLLEGIQRPGIAIRIPTLKGSSLIIDVGANIDSKPFHLLQYAIMGEAYMRLVLGKSGVKIGLLNIGEEESKGTDFMKKTYQLLSSSNLNFIGNIEAKDIFTGRSDVVVCDGVVGNIALKVSEGFADSVTGFLKDALRRTFLSRLGALIIKKSLKKFLEKLDYAEYGGAPLLGVNGVVIICHGRSDARAIKNAIRVATQEVKSNLNQKITEFINA